jgi:radical SAM superfamily enzyme YgiQ (UPF0313 family)
VRIALVAMSGIRVVDAELVGLGLTLPGFVERAKTIASLPSLGLLTLAGATHPRHEVRYFEVADLSTAAALPTDFDLVAISSFSAQIGEGYALARRFRAAGVPVVMGGLHVTALPEEAVAAGASAIVGEGENVWEEVLRDAEAGALKPIYDGREHPLDLALAPMPRYDLLDPERYNRITVQASRGCPWRCSFCASSILLVPRYKQKPVERVLAEVDRIREVWPHPFLEFADDNAFVNRAYWRELLPALEERGVRWFAETDLSVHEDPEFLRALKRSGCRQVLIGFESPVEAGLDGIETNRNWKWERRGLAAEVVRRIQAEGIRVNACFVVGLDGHGPAIFDAIYDFAREACPFDVQVTYPTPFPGTPMYRRWKREGRLTHDGQWERCTLFDINFRPTPMSASELRAGFHDLVSRLYAEDFTAWRREEARRHRRRPRKEAFAAT